MQDLTETALRMLRRYGPDRASGAAADYAFALHGPGPAREFWKAVDARISELTRVRAR